MELTRRSLLFLLGILAAPHTVAKGSGTTLPDRTDNSSQKEDHAMSFSEEVKRHFNLLKLPGLSVAVVQDGEIVYRQTEGFADVEKRIPLDDDSIFWAASLTKTFAAVLMMRYAQEGKASPDDYLLQYPYLSVGFFPQRIDPNLKLKHVLSHTSEGVPGSAFVYNGGRYNFIYGVFEKMSGELKIPDAFPKELSARILQPLKMESSLAGYPEKEDHPLRSKIVTPYRFDSEKGANVVNPGAYGSHTAYPSSGLLTSVRDLATYAVALDRDELISKASYERMTTPFVSPEGQIIPYGFGWFAQRFEGVRLHWAYGYGDSDSALLLRVPDRKLTLIVMSNSDLMSASTRLGYGDVLRSLLAVSFLKRFVLASDSPVVDYDEESDKLLDVLTKRKDRLTKIDLEEAFTQSLARSCLNEMIQKEDEKPKRLMQWLFKTNPNFFDRIDISLLFLISQMKGDGLTEMAERAIHAYEASGAFHPEALFSIATYYDKRGDHEKAMRHYRALAETRGFEEQGATFDALGILAKNSLEKKKLDEARRFAWKGIVASRQMGRDESSFIALLERINRSQASISQA